MVIWPDKRHLNLYFFVITLSQQQHDSFNNFKWNFLTAASSQTPIFHYFSKIKSDRHLQQGCQSPLYIIFLCLSIVIWSTPKGPTFAKSFPKYSKSGVAKVSSKYRSLRVSKKTPIIKSIVVYFDQHSGALCTQKMVEILFWQFWTFLLILDVFLWIYYHWLKKSLIVK